MKTKKDWKNELILSIARSKNNSKLTGHLSLHAGDVGQVIIDSLPTCDIEECSNPMTVESEVLLSRMCDHHAARIIYYSKSDVNLWKDVQNATSIRRLLDHIDIVRENDVTSIH